MSETERQRERKRERIKVKMNIFKNSKHTHKKSIQERQVHSVKLNRRERRERARDIEKGEKEQDDRK